MDNVLKSFINSVREQLVELRTRESILLCWLEENCPHENKILNETLTNLDTVYDCPDCGLIIAENPINYKWYEYKG